jgi:U3 small nucleolar RNA-associated protein 15
MRWRSARKARLELFGEFFDVSLFVSPSLLLAARSVSRVTMGDFKRIQIARYAVNAQQTGDKTESRYWRSFKVSRFFLFSMRRSVCQPFSVLQNPVFIKSYAPITSIDFSASTPHRYAVTSGTRIQIYSPKTARVVKVISRFKDTARSGTIRDDGKLVVAGDDSGLVQVWLFPS